MSHFNNLIPQFFSSPRFSSPFLLAYSPKFQAILARGRQQIQKIGGVAHEDFWQEMEAKAE